MTEELVEPPPRRRGGVAADASFLETMDQTASVLDLHRSNLLRLQAEELVNECRLVAPPKDVAPFLETLTSMVLSVSLSKNIKCSLESCPFPLHSDNTARLLEAAKKAQLRVLHTNTQHSTWLGRGSCHTKASGNANVLPTYDLVVQMPDNLWDAKDYKNHRYFDKRNIVVWHVAQTLAHKKHRSKVGKVYWSYEQHDQRKPTLLVIPPSTATTSSNNKKRKSTPSKPKFRVQIRFEVESLDWVPPLRLVPNRCNLPARHANDKSGSPIYNHALLEDAYHSFLPKDNDDEDEYPHWKDTVILAQVWALQRGLLRNHDGFTTDTIALLILYLYRTKQANARMAPLQVLAVLFKCLGETVWMEDDTTNDGSNDNDNHNNLLRQSPSEASQHAATQSSKKRRKRAVLVLPLADHTEAQTTAQSALAKVYAQQTKESPVTDHDPSTLMDLYRQQYPGPVFLDPTMRFNYFGRLSPSFLKLARQEASRSLLFLNSNALGESAITDKPFAALFMTPARFWDRFDLHIKVPLKHIRTEATTKTVKALWNQADAGRWEAISRSIMTVLQQALGDRVTSMRLLSTGNGAASITNESDQIPWIDVSGKKRQSVDHSPNGDDSLVLGVSLNADTCPRIVDRGPPAEQADAVQSFKEFWGGKAELRRFKDGAIVQAVVWNTTKGEPNTVDIHYQNEDTTQGGIVERIIHYMLDRHFLTSSTSEKMVHSSPLRHLASLVDGVATESVGDPWFTNPTHAHRSAMKAFEGLASFLRDHSLPTVSVPGSLEEKTSRLGIPLPIDAVEPLSPTLRYSELFPPIPHSLLGGTGVKGLKRTAGAIGSEPILIQIRFGASSKWPTDIKAIGAAKTAMLIQLANGIEEMQSTSPGECDGFSKLITVTPSYVDIGFKGYLFRLQVRADPEIRLLRGLFKPSMEAATLLNALTRDHVVLAMHHSMIHAVHTKHASAGVVVRLAMRWTSGHMLSGLIPQEAIELLVAKVYTETSSSTAPGSTAAGFLQFLRLLESHDWIREPLIVDPHGHIDDEDRNAITARFEQARGPSHEGGPPMYIVSPNDRNGIDDALKSGDAANTARTVGKSSSLWAPSFTSQLPEWVVLTRTIALARKTRVFLTSKMTSFEQSGTWSAAFQETSASFQAYNALLRIDSELVVDTKSSSTTGKSLLPVASSEGDGAGQIESSYTQSIRDRHLGPKKLRLKVYKNMHNDEMTQVLHDFRPVDLLVQSLRRNFGPLALFFYNQLCPDVIGILWRPHAMASSPFSVVGSEHAQPCVNTQWKGDTMMMLNVNDVLREMSQFWEGIVVKAKVFPSTSRGKAVNDESDSSGKQKRKKAKKNKTETDESESSSETS